MVKILPIYFFFLFSLKTFGQILKKENNELTKKTTIGFRLSSGFGKSNESNLTQSVNMPIGQSFSLGGFFEGPGNHWHLQLGFNFLKRNITYQALYPTDYLLLIRGRDQKNLLSLNILAEFKPKKKNSFTIYLGPEVMYVISENLADDGAPDSPAASISYRQTPILGLITGLDFSITKNFGFDLRYDLSFLHLYKKQYYNGSLPIPIMPIPIDYVGTPYNGTEIIYNNIEFGLIYRFQ